MAWNSVDVGSFPTRNVHAQLTRCGSDEADVFLDSRGSKGDVYPEQNAMVSGMFSRSQIFELY